MDDTQQDGMSVVDDVAGIAAPDVILVLDEEVVGGVQLVTGANDRAPQNGIRAAAAVGIHGRPQDLAADIRHPLIGGHEAVLAEATDAVDVRRRTRIERSQCKTESDPQVIGYV